MSQASGADQCSHHPEILDAVSSADFAYARPWQGGARSKSSLTNPPCLMHARRACLDKNAKKSFRHGHLPIQCGQCASLRHDLIVKSMTYSASRMATVRKNRCRTGACLYSIV